MTRPVLAVLFVSLVVTSAGLGQTAPTLSLTLSSAEPPEVFVQAQHLLTRGFLEGLRSGFPLHLVYQTALKEERPFKDRTVSEFPFEFVVLFDPVRERFAVESRDATTILSDESALERHLSRVYQLGLEPDQAGRFYYEGTVEARMLSDEDVDEAFAWLRGENSDSVRLQDPGFLARLARRVLVRASAMPRVRLEARTSEFTVP